MKELWVPISGAIAQQRKVEAIANNVANANTPGFKKDDLVFREHLTAFEKGGDIDLPNKEWAPEDFYRSNGAEHSFVKVDGSFTNFQQGQLSPSQNPFDLALSGPGFFEVHTPNGIRYTRKGNFSLSAEGDLVNDQGHALMAKLEIPKVESSEELQNIIKELPKPQERRINISRGKFFINQQGEVFLNNNNVGTISVVEFKNTQVMKKEGNSLFINNDIRNIKDSDLKTTVRQGFVEQSNVNAIEEMSNLIKAHRQFESIQKVIKAYDNLAGKASNEIARF